MATMRSTHLAIFLAIPLVVAAATGLAREPEAPVAFALHEPVDEPPPSDADGEPAPRQALASAPPRIEPEYPLAVAFNPAHRSNYGFGHMRDHNYIVVHTMEGYYYGAQSWFQNRDADVSAHFCMRSDGQITQMVSLHDKAWHVGRFNDQAIGIEHEGFVERPSWYTWEVYQSSATLTRWLADTYDIPRDREHIVGHSELPLQTHEDPGENWDWDLYMALIDDLVPQGQVEGWVVDPTRSCTITALEDTWIKRTLESETELDDTQKCSVLAGTQLSYLHASEDLDGHHRLDYEPDHGPCEGFIDLDRQGYVVAADFTGACDPAPMAAPGLTVVLDEGARVVTDQDGYFSFIEVAPGPHSLDVLGGHGYAATMEPIDVDVFPGHRIVIRVDGQSDELGRLPLTITGPRLTRPP